MNLTKILYMILFIAASSLAESVVYNSRIKAFDYLEGGYIGIRLYNIESNWLNGSTAQKESGGFVISPSSPAGNRLLSILIKYYQTNTPVSIVGTGVTYGGKWEEISSMYTGDLRSTSVNYEE